MKTYLSFLRMDDIILLALERFTVSYVHSERVQSEKEKCDLPDKITNQ